MKTTYVRVIAKLNCATIAPETLAGRAIRLYDADACERRLKSAARGGRKVQRWGWVESTPG